MKLFGNRGEAESETTSFDGPAGHEGRHVAPDQAPATQAFSAPDQATQTFTAPTLTEQPAPAPVQSAPAPQGGYQTIRPAVMPSGALAAQGVDVHRHYGSGDNVVRALNGVTVGFEQARFTAIMGPSGSGKSTLMHCMAGLDRVTGGSVRIGDAELSQMGDKALTNLRRDRLGFIFQSFNLVPTLNAIENITLPLDIAGRKADPAWMEKVITTLKLGDRLKHRPSELSGGQQQRVACARALVGQPAVIFGDEPTGNLDSKTSTEVLDMLRDSVDQLGQTVVIVTHDPRAASFADRVIFLADGQLVGEMLKPTADDVLEAMKGMEG